MHIATGIRWYEVNKISVRQATANSTILVYIDDYMWDETTYAQSNAWDAIQPMQVRTGQSIYFYIWEPAATTTTGNTATGATITTTPAAAGPPEVTIWLRYDTALEGTNVQVAGGLCRGITRHSRSPPQRPCRR
jgi:hypothetical protein